MIVGDDQLAKDYFAMLRSKFFEEVEASGGRIVTPKPDELQIDIDDEASAVRFAAVLPMLVDRLGAYVVNRHFSPSGAPHEHITLAVNRELSEIERIALQAIAGSDPRRELFGFVRVMVGDECPTAFAEWGPDEAFRPIALEGDAL